MQSLNLQELQNFFLETICSNPNEDIHIHFQKPMSKEFNEKTKYRMQAYRTSYYSRVSSVLSDCLFYLGCYHLGRQTVSQLLIDYFSKFNSSDDIITSARQFPHFLTSNESIQHYYYAPDLMQMCLHIYDILSVKDPDINAFISNRVESINPKEIFLQKEHIFMKSNSPVFQLYESFYAPEKVPIQNRAENVLFVKSSACEVQSILIPQNYVQIIEFLKNGLPLKTAIELSEIDFKNLDENDFIKWMTTLTNKCALIYKK